jgi:cytochrome b6-f complex iron-sulfur subunit
MPDSQEDHTAPSDEALSKEGKVRRVLIGAGVGTLGACYAGVIAYPVYRYLNTPSERAASAPAVTEVALTGADKLPPGAAKAFLFGRRPALLIHQKDGSWTAFDAVCTHKGCTVQYQPGKDRIFCACHDGVYNPETGAVIDGPPPKGLKQYTVEVKDGEIIIGRG